MQEKNQSNSLKENYRELLDLVSEPIMVLNRKGILLAANKSLGRFIDVPTEGLIGKHFENLNLFGKDKQKIIERNLEKRLNGENIQDYELTVCINGKSMCIEPKGNKIEYFGEDADLIILHDVTKRTQHHTQLLGKIAEKDELCQKTEDKYMKLFLGSIDAIFIADIEGVIVDCNPAACLLFGMNRAELIGKHYSILHAETLMEEAFKKELREQNKSCPIKPVESRMMTKKGEVKYVSVRFSGFEFQGKKFLQGTFRDVTEHRLMEQAMQEKEKKFYGITNSVKDAIVLVDEEAKVTYWNPAAEKIFGYLSSETIGKSIHALVVPNTLCKEGKERIEYSVKTFSETGTGYFTVGNVELIGRRKDGEEFPVELSLSPLKLNGKWNAVGVIKDITDRKKAVEKTRQAEQRYHAFFNQAPLGVLVVDPQTGAFIEFNDIAHSQLAYTREEFSTLSVFDIEAKESPEETKTHLYELAKTGGEEFETKHRTKNGEIKNVIVTIKTIELPGKSLLHCIFHDITEIKKIHSSLVESEARYRQLVEIAQAGIWALNNDYETVFVNPRISEMLGYTESEMIGKKLFDFLDKGAIEKVRDIMRKFNAPNAKGQYEYAFPRKDRTHIITSLAISTITDDQGRSVGILALVTDLTERKKLEDALRASEERFRAISTSALDGIILVDAEDKVLYWNPAAERTFGYAEQEVLDRKLSELVVPKQGRVTYRALMKDLNNNLLTKKHFEFKALRKDGSMFPMDLSVASVTLKGKNCLLAIVRDISERKNMEEALKQERDMLEAITENVNAALMLVNKEYQVIWLNKFGKELYGDITNKKCYSGIHTQNSICSNCGVKKVLDGASTNTRETTTTQNNKVRSLKVIATPIKDNDGKITGVLELGMDITEIKKMQTELGKYSQKLEELVQHRTELLKQTQAKLVKSERLAAIGELAGMIGHDLRNPLTGIKNSAYFLKKKGTSIPEAQAREMLETIDKCVDYSNKIVNDLLDYSREIHLELQVYSPKKLLTESLSMINVPDTIEVVNQLPEQPHLKVDLDKVKRIFINLIKNAIEAMPNVGKLTVDGKEVNGLFEISFADTGPGISDSILPNLFLPLFTTKAQGMGFGLAICKRIIEAHGGTITVKTAIGEGTTFTVTLPIQPKIEIGGEKVWINMPESSLLTTTKQ